MSVRRACDRSDARFMSTEGRELTRRGRIPDAHGAVLPSVAFLSSARGYPLAVARKSARQNLGCVPGQPLHIGTTDGIPQAHGTGVGRKGRYESEPAIAGQGSDCPVRVARRATDTYVTTVEQIPESSIPLDRQLCVLSEGGGRPGKGTQHLARLDVPDLRHRLAVVARIPKRAFEQSHSVTVWRKRTLEAPASTTEPELPQDRSPVPAKDFCAVAPARNQEQRLVGREGDARYSEARFVAADRASSLEVPDDDASTSRPRKSYVARGSETPGGRHRDGPYIVATFLQDHRQTRPNPRKGASESEGYVATHTEQSRPACDPRAHRTLNENIAPRETAGLTRGRGGIRPLPPASELTAGRARRRLREKLYATKRRTVAGTGSKELHCG